MSAAKFLSFLVTHMGEWNNGKITTVNYKSVRDMRNTILIRNWFSYTQCKCVECYTPFLLLTLVISHCQQYDLRILFLQINIF